MLFALIGRIFWILFIWRTPQHSFLVTSCFVTTRLRITTFNDISSFLRYCLFLNFLFFPALNHRRLSKVVCAALLDPQFSIESISQWFILYIFRLLNSARRWYQLSVWYTWLDRLFLRLFLNLFAETAVRITCSHKLFKVVSFSFLANNRRPKSCLIELFCVLTDRLWLQKTRLFLLNMVIGDRLVLSTACWI